MGIKHMGVHPKYLSNWDFSAPFFDAKQEQHTFELNYNWAPSWFLVLISGGAITCKLAAGIFILYTSTYIHFNLYSPQKNPLLLLPYLISIFFSMVVKLFKICFSTPLFFPQIDKNQHHYQPMPVLPTKPVITICFCYVCRCLFDLIGFFIFCIFIKTWQSTLLFWLSWSK